jgi:hypothetical protein
MDPVTTGLTTAVARTFGIAHLIKGEFLGDTNHEYIEVSSNVIENLKRSEFLSKNSEKKIGY